MLAKEKKLKMHPPNHLLHHLHLEKLDLVQEREQHSLALVQVFKSLWKSLQE